MKQEKVLTKNQIFVIKLLFFLCICAIGVGFFFFSRQQGNNKSTIPTENTVVYQKGKLSIFGDTYTLFPDTDKIGVHENYIFVVEPRKEKTTVYDKKRYKKVTILKQLALDYDGKNVLYNKSGIDTYFNDIALGVRCTSGHIKNATEILCILPKKDDNLDNKLVSIDPQSLITTDLYASGYTLYYVSYLKDDIYIGAFSLQMKKNYLLVNSQLTEVQDRVNVIYEKENASYFGSFQNELNNHTENYYLIEQVDNGVKTRLIEKGRIVF